LIIIKSFKINYYYYLYKLTFLFFALGLPITVLSQNEINPNGYNKFYYKNGALSSEGNFKNGKPEGYWKTYYSTGTLKSEGYRKNFVLDSSWKFYDENGILSQIIRYQND